MSCRKRNLDDPYLSWTFQSMNDVHSHHAGKELAGETFIVFARKPIWEAPCVVMEGATARSGAGLRVFFEIKPI